MNKLEIKITSTSNSWSDELWKQWDNCLLENPSAYLDSRSIKAALDVVSRRLQAVMWVNSEGQTLGIAQVEDTHAVSQARGKFLKADKPFFKLAQQYLYRGDGVFQFNVRVLGTVLSSGDHAYSCLLYTSPSPRD